MGSLPGAVRAAVASLLGLAMAVPAGAAVDEAPTTLAAVTDVRVAARDDGSGDERSQPVTISWQPAAGAEAQEVESRTEGGPWQRLATLAPDAVATEAALPVALASEVRVRGVDASGTGEWSTTGPLVPAGDGRIRSPATETILVAGDIATCASDADSATARIIAANSGLVMTAGDNVYDSGSPPEFRDCYDPTWGRFKVRTRPVIGNHDYATPGAAGYYDYFGERAGPRGRGYYAFDHGTWRIYALDSNCETPGGCRKGSAQYEWLRQDLADHPRRCSLAVLHHPHFSSGPHGNSSRTIPLLRLLYDAGVEIVVNGHDHIYERFAPARPWGGEDPDHGIRQFIVGTGGGPLYSWKPEGRPAHSQKRQNGTYGVLRLRLGWDAYAWDFLAAVRDDFTDNGTGSCHGRPGDAGPGADAGPDTDADPGIGTAPGTDAGPGTDARLDTEP